MVLCDYSGSMDGKSEMKCKYCKSNHLVHHDYVVTVNQGKKSRFKCKDCGHTQYEGGE